MKIILHTMCFLAFTIVFQDLSTIRKDYVLAVEDEQSTRELHQALTSVAQDGDYVLLAYKGAVSTLMAKHAKKIRDKRAFFKEGANLIDYAIEQEPDNIELRYIRLSVQENAPKIVGYDQNIPEDKQVLITNFKNVNSSELKALIRNYVSQSLLFEDAERQLF